MEAMFTDAAAAASFLMAGNAYITLRSKATGTRYTYRVAKSKDGRCHFVSTLYGPSNESDYAYVGMIRNDTFGLTKKSQYRADSPQYLAFQFMWRNLLAGAISDKMEFWHEGRCGRCGRMLTVPESIASGIGPECAKKVGMMTAPYVPPTFDALDAALAGMTKQ